MTTKRRSPEPETIVRGSAPLSKGVDKVAAKLEADGAKTGNYTALFAHNRAKRATK